MTVLRPGFFLNAFANDAYVEGLAKCVKQGLTDTVGVSNFKEDRLRSTHRVLSERGIPLASNQVQYSLLYRNPEKNGVLAACKDLGITLMAYSPLCQGLLTGGFHRSVVSKLGVSLTMLHSSNSHISSIHLLTV